MLVRSRQQTLSGWPLVTLVVTGTILALATATLWATHVVLCIKTSAWVLLLFGIIVPPVGLIHGFAFWAGLL